MQPQAAPPKKEEGPKRPEHVLGKTVPQDVEDTAWALSLRCDASDAKACTDLGQLHASTQWNARDEKRAAELYGKACRYGDAAGCENLAEAYTHGRGVGRDLEKGRGFHEQACKGQRAYSCGVLGTYYAIGYTVTRESKRAREYLHRACEDGDSAACELRGTVEACEANDKDACARLDQLKTRYDAQDAK